MHWPSWIVSRRKRSDSKLDCYCLNFKDDLLCFDMQHIYYISNSLARVSADAISRSIHMFWLDFQKLAAHCHQFEGMRCAIYINSQ